MTHRKITDAKVVDWRGHDPETEWGIRCTFEDGVIFGAGIGSKEKAEAAAKEALERGEDFVRDLMAANGRKWIS